jgi:ferredoxin like protein
MSNRIEEKLFQNRYMVDAGRPHIKVKEHDVPSEPLKSLVTTCPAGCYSLNEQGKV